MEKSNFESTQEFFDQWLKVYNATTGRLVDMPSLGPSREKSEKMMKGFSTFVNLYMAGMEPVPIYRVYSWKQCAKCRKRLQPIWKGKSVPTNISIFTMSGWKRIARPSRNSRNQVTLCLT